MNLPPLQAEARLQSEIKATKTIAITVAAFVLCYVPTIAYAAVGGSRERKQVNPWFAFIASSSLYISSAVNPIIYYLRTKRFRLAFKQFLKDPFGSSDFNGEPNSQVKGELKDKPRKWDGKRVEGGDAHQTKHENQTGQKYSGKRRNGIGILSIESLEADLYVHHDVGDGREYEEGKEESGDARRSSRQARNSCQGQIEESEEENEVSKNCGLENESRKQQPFSSRKKVFSMGVSSIGKAGASADEGKPDVNVRCSERETKSRDSSEKSTNAVATIEEFDKVLEEAWISEEEEEEEKLEQEAT